MLSTDPQSSTAKVARAIDDAFNHLPAIQQGLSGMQAIMFAPLAQFAPQLRQMALQQLPTDPRALDALLDKAAELITGMKSDLPAIDAQAVELA
jgi:hypothetical protein